MTYQLGQIGLGHIGKIYAGHLLKANGQLVVFDAQREHVGALEQNGATVANSPQEVASQSEIVVMALPSPEAVRTVMLGDQGILKSAKPDTLILDMSTVDPFTCKELYDAAKQNKVRYLEAPVSGGQPKGAGTDGARAANVTFMVGGDEEDFERAKPIMSFLGKHWFHLGPAGSGSAVKLISNLVSGVANLVAAEAIILGAAAGISWEKLLAVFKQTDANSFHMMNYMEPRMVRNDFEPGFSVDLMYKDHRLAGDLAQKLGVPVLFNQLALQVYQVLRANGRGSKDFADALNLMGEWSGVDFHHPRKPFNE